MYDEFFKILGQILVAGGGIIFITYQAFKYLAAKWLDARFAKNLQHLIHEQTKEIENLRNELTKSFDRKAKLHQREFEVLPDLWAKTNDAYWQTKSLVSILQSHPDLNRMNESHLLKFITECELADWQKEELQKEQDKTKYFIEKIFWHKAFETKQKITNASSTLGRNGIFINSITREKLDTFLTLLWTAVVEKERDHESSPRPRSYKDIDELNANGEKMRKVLEQEIQDILWTDPKNAL
jgi:hypothetical protein